ncbi:MAG TPA: hypothetical protein VK081_03255 [Planctomycetota bacterium]|nr:hypothetical protein [Planctomycetota bacterium]
MRLRRGVAGLLLALVGCSDAEPIGIHVKVAADGTAVVTCRSLHLSSDAGPMEAGSRGIEWQERAVLFASRGRVADLNELRLLDVEVRRTGPTSLRLSFPRGPDVKWHAALAPSAEGRSAAAAALDPSQPSTSVGDTIRIEVETDSEVTAAGHAPIARMVKSEKDGTRALLWIPVATARESGEPIVFDVVWR